MGESKTKPNNKIQGERIAIRGYKPQYEEFARRVYESILDESLVEIRVADYDQNVGNLDDICYVTHTEVMAYQVKWSNTGRVVTFGEFKKLVRDVAEGWEKIRALYPNKKIVPHLLTNRKLSSSFNLEKPENIAQLKDQSKLNDEEWVSFWKNFEFIHDYVPENFDVSRRRANKRVADVLDLVNFIVGKVADKEGFVIIKKQEIINGLIWNDRLKKIYNHNLVVAESSYEPNAKALARLDAILKGKTKGYIFLKGTPGSGKSTILTQWVRSLPNCSFRYYAFDFTNPSSQRFNDTQRGEAVSFLFDIVQQIETAGFGRSDILRYKDYDFLKNRFYDLMNDLSNEYQKTKIPFLIVVDGLDHITREYNVCQKNLMEVLPSITEVRDGVVFVLGSQQFDQLGLNQSINREFKSGSSTVEMPAFSKDEVSRLVMKILGEKVIMEDLLAKCVEKSQGHPLYLRYMLNQILANGVEVIDSIPDYTDNVELYYERMVGSSLGNMQMKHFLGLLSRVAGAVNLNQVGTWNVDNQVQNDFRKEMSHLFKFSDDGNMLLFFHNSFRQYLLNKTAANPLTDKYDKQINLNYYKELASYYANEWDEGYYLFHAEEYDAFVERLTPEALFEQAKNFRPLWSIRKDFEYAVSIAKQKKDAYLLVRYMLFEVQLSQMENLDYSSLSLVEEFIHMGEVTLAKSITREDNKLHCNTSYALQLAKLYFKSGDKEEAAKLFDLAYPEYVTQPLNDRGLNRAEFDDELKKLSSWVNTAAYFMPWETVEEKTKLFIEYLRKKAHLKSETFNVDRIQMDFVWEYAISLIEQKRWVDLEVLINTFKGNNRMISLRYVSLRDAALKCNEDGDKGKASDYYKKLEKAFEQLPEDDKPYFQMAYFGWKIGIEEKNVEKYLEKVAWKDFDSYYLSGFRPEFTELRPHIAYIKLRAALGYDDSITDLVPSNPSDPDNAIMEQYVRKVFYLAKLSGKAINEQYVTADVLSLIDNYLSFFDGLSLMHHNKYEYTILCQRVDFYEYMIEVATQCGTDVLERLAEKMQSYFGKSSCDADAKSKRRVALALHKKGIDRQLCIRMLNTIENTMLDYKDHDGRTEEVMLQGKAWLALGETDKAKQLFGKMVMESFGIGYRKDHQPSMFAEWISRINKSEPEKCIERTYWMTSRFRYVQEVTQRSTVVRAGEELLTNTLKSNLGAGLKLARWLLDEEFGYFQSVSKRILESFLDKALTQDEYLSLLSYYTQIHLYFDNSGYDPDTELLNNVVRKGKALLNSDFGRIKFSLQESIKTQCPENSVEKMLKTLDEALLTSVSDVQNGSLITPSADVETWETAMTALKQSSASGWVRFYDGGSRIDACKRLLNVDKDKGREVTFNMLADDIETGWYNYGIMDDLDEILPLLTDQIDESRVFQEKFAYMNRILRQNTICVSDKPDITPTDETLLDTLENWLLYLTQMPVICLSEQTMMLLTKMLDNGRTRIVDKMKQYADSERKLLELGMFLKEMGSKQLFLLKKQAQKSATSDNYLYRIYARAILAALGETTPKPPYRPLSLIYQMEFADSLKYDWGDTELKKEGVSDWNDASSIMKVASHISRYLAYVSGVSIKSIEERALLLMRKYGQTTEENAEIDKNISKHFDTIGLRCPYRRAHALAALDGMYEVAAELLDGKAVNGQYDDSWFLSYDFSVIKIQVCTKPDFIQRINEHEHGGVPKGWETNLMKSPRFNDGMNHFKEMNVIGEFTHVFRCDYQVPMEEFLSKISFDDEKKSANKFFGVSATQIQSSDYWEVGADDPQIIIRRSGAYSISSIKLHWIAINPAFAYTMGWKPSNSGLFAWDDAEGNRMVESVYWQSGNVNARENSNHETGEGWLVLASDGAFEAIKAESSLSLQKLLQRGLHAKTIEFLKSESMVVSL